MPLQPEVSTLVELLERRARASAEGVAFSFGGRDQTWAALRANAGQLAASLAERGIDSEDRVILVLPNGAEFFDAFYGVLGAGAVPVPLFPPSGAERIVGLARSCEASLVLVAPDVPPETFDRLAADLAGERQTVVRVPVSAGPSTPGTSAKPNGFGPVDRHQTALIQYNSGSTGDPKGVVLTRHNLLTNARQMIAGMEITAQDVFVSWLPVHHDMGLIFMTLVPFLLGARLVLLPSSLNDVRSWLGAITEHRGTFTAAPGFAYRLCLRAVRDPSRLDLSSLRVALDAAECAPRPSGASRRPPVSSASWCRATASPMPPSASPC